MEQLQRENQVLVLYIVGACLSVMTIICTAVPWNYWQEILDNCVSTRCGCILYGTDQYKSFNGGSSSLCLFTTLGSIPAFLMAIVMAVYHGYRVIIAKRKTHQRNTRLPRRNGEVAVLKETLEEPGCICRTVIVILTIGIGTLLFVNAIMLVDGYYSTCGQYRKTLSKNMDATGMLSSAIYGRLPCGGIYDFMDYLEPKRRPFIKKEYLYYYGPHEENDRVRGGFINTGLSLQLAISSAWFNCAVWLALFVLNCLLLRASGCCWGS